MEETGATSWDFSMMVAVGVSAVAMAAVLFFFISRRRNPLLTYVEHMALDTSGRFLHIFGAERIMPEDGDSFDIWHHRLLELQSLTFHQGERQRGNDLELDSPFVSRSMQRLSQELRTPLGLGVAALPPDDSGFDASWDDEDSSTVMEPVVHPELVLLDGTDTDTVKPRKLPADCIAITKISSEPSRFTLAQFRNGREAFSIALKGDSEYFAKVSWIPGKPWMAMTYRKSANARTGMALLIYDYQRCELVMDAFIKATQRTQ